MPLKRIESDFINAHDYGSWYYWIDGLVYSATGYETNRDVIRALIAEPWYHHNYFSPRRKKPDAKTQTIHGPYRLDAMSADSFVPCTGVDALARLHLWLDENRSTPQMISDFELLMDKLLPEGWNLFELLDLGESAQHETGSISGADTGFIEFLAISADMSSVNVLVASDD